LDSAERSPEDVCLPHLRAAYSLARWLTRDEHDAEDLVQEAFLRAIKYLDGAPEISNARAWLLRIVRNTFYSSRARSPAATPLDEAVHGSSDAFDPEAALLRTADRELVHEALGELAVEFREAIVLRELEGLSYKEIAEVTGVPPGTVMSRLSRARRALAERLARRLGKELAP
jgi:RNA polymerase sigma-70 factor (ECF subfamily)